MIAQGTDGLSRGDLIAGAMSGTPPMEFVPLNQDCLERSFLIRGWLSRMLQGLPSAEFLSPERWFEIHDDGGVYV